MDPITTAVAEILGKYAVDKGAELVKEAGPKALEAAKEMFTRVVDRLRCKPDGDLVARKLEEGAGSSKELLKEELEKEVATDPDLVEQLKTLVARYEQAAKEHAATGGVTVVGQVHGDVVTGTKSTVFDQRGQSVGQQVNVAGDMAPRKGREDDE